MRSAQGADDGSNRQVGLSLPGSRCLLVVASAGRCRPDAACCSAGAPTLVTVLNGLRDERGRPNARVKLLAVLVALMLAGPLTVLVVQVLVNLVGALY